MHYYYEEFTDQTAKVISFEGALFINKARRFSNKKSGINAVITNDLEIDGDSTDNGSLEASAYGIIDLEEEKGISIKNSAALDNASLAAMATPYLVASAVGATIMPFFNGLNYMKSMAFI